MQILKRDGPPTAPTFFTFSMNILKKIRSLKPSRFVLGALILMLVIAVPIMATLDTNSGNARTARVFSTPINPIEAPPRNFNGLFVLANITNLDLNNFIFKSSFDFIPMGSLAVGGNDPIFKRPNFTMNVVLGSKLITFRPFVPMASQPFDIPVDTGNVNRYPFDAFSSKFILYANTAEVGQPQTNVEVAFAIVGAIQAWRTDIKVVPQAITGSQFIEVTVTSVRSFTVQFFSLFIVCCMWILSFSIFTLATTLWFRDRAVEPPTIGLCASLLFAMPAIRSTQPNIPPIGCTVDLIGFFWNMFLVLVSTCLLMANYVIKYQRTNAHQNPFK
jgi:hypothetical protein